MSGEPSLGANIRVLCTELWTYFHHAIYVGNGMVIDKTEQGVRKRTMAAAGFDYFEEIREKADFSAKQILERAEAYVRRPREFGAYNLASNNCEHFVHFIRNNRVPYMLGKTKLLERELQHLGHYLLLIR
mmetsp:Transcript_19910/g.64823  ORF Transcript_19910/g.64823 Transcript_19910/m.64823 type:complete len:130 (+) Transcript_19910:114-503(+)